MSMLSPSEILLENGFFPDVSQRESFLRACADGRDDIVGAYLELGMPVDGGVLQGVREIPLIKAVEGGRRSTVELLLDRGADLEARDDSEDTAFATALSWKHFDLARWLLDRGADIESPKACGASLLQIAISRDEDEAYALLLERGANPRYMKNGCSPLAMAIHKDVSIVAALLDAGAPATLVIDASTGETALHWAVRRKKEDAVALLLERGASARTHNAYGQTALDFALLVDDADLVARLSAASEPPDERQLAIARVWRLVADEKLDEALVLIAEGVVPLMIRNERGWTFLAAFAAAGHAAGVRQLLAAGARPVGLEWTEWGLQRVNRGESLEAIRVLLEACLPAQRSRAGEAVLAACKSEPTGVVELLLEHGVPGNAVEPHDATSALAQAVASHYSHDNARALLDAGVDIEWKNRRGRTALFDHLSDMRWEESWKPTLELLLSRGARLDVVDCDGRTGWRAARDGAKQALVRALVTRPLEEGLTAGDLAKRHDWSTLPMFLHAERVDLLFAVIDAGVSIDPPASESAETVLDEAVEREDVALVRGLLARGARTDRVPAGTGRTALMHAATMDTDEILRLLLDAGADPRVRNATGETVLAWAEPQHIALLVARGAPIDDRAPAPLVSAARRGSIPDAKALLEHGARLDVRDEDGRTPLLLALDEDARELALFLIEAGASINDRARDGETALTVAAKKGELAVVRRLLEKGASLEDVDGDGIHVRALVLGRKELREGLADVLAAAGVEVTKPVRAPIDPSLTTCTEAWAAVYRGDVAAVGLAIESGALGVDERDAWGVTPLMAAVVLKRQALVSELLRRGADASLRDPEGVAARDYSGFDVDEEIDTMLEEVVVLSPHEMMDSMNARAGRQMLANELDDAIGRGEIARVVAMITEKKVHPFLGVLGTPILDHARRDDDLFEALVELGYAPS